MIVVQLSDPHVVQQDALLKGQVDTNGLLAQAVRRVLRLRPLPDRVWITGDLVATGRSEEYDALVALLSPLTMPLHLLPGNHDDRDLLRAAFHDHDYLPREGKFLHYVVETSPVVETEPVRMIGLDTVIPGEMGGEMCPERLAWLEARLAEAPGRPTVIFMHHPPFEVGLPVDRYLCRNGDALEKLVSRYPNIQRIGIGHAHRSIQRVWGGTLACVCPSTAHQFLPEFEETEAIRYGLEPPGFLVHHWRNREAPVTHFIPSGEFPGECPASG
ncbi:MAG: phosphodiesterase [bacterium]